jgi:hypothetical protein
MHATLTIKLWDDLPPIVKFDIWNTEESREATIKFLFIMHEGERTSSFERTWLFRFPRPIRNVLNLMLLGVNYTVAIYCGLLRGLEIGVITPEAAQNALNWDVTAELQRED